MWDLNAAERRALAASLILVGLAGLARVARTSDAAGLEWVRADASAPATSPRDSVAAALAREARAQTPLAAGERIDVSTAPAEELRRLPGVGPGLAAAIERERRIRPFARVADLERVPGIGPATMARLSEHVRVTTMGAAVGEARSVGDRRPATSMGCTSGRVDVNGATGEALTELPGVGPVIAARIVETRDRSGPFASVEALARVPGIGPRSIERLRARACAG